MKFICDQMLVRLGRWLRAAGYDTVIIDRSMPDTEILSRALAEGRILLTRDRFFVGKENSIFLTANTVESCAEELSREIKIDWLEAPFTRCLECNAILEPEDLGTFCPQCQKHYWEGSHTQRMLATLTRWNAIT